MRAYDQRGVDQDAGAQEQAELVLEPVAADRHGKHAEPAQVVLTVLDALDGAFASQLQRRGDAHLDLDRLRDVVNQQRQVGEGFLHSSEVRQHLVHAVRVVVRWRERQRVSPGLHGMASVAKREAGRAVADVGDDRHAAGDLFDRGLDRPRALRFSYSSEFASCAHRPDAVHPSPDQKVDQAP